MYTKILLCPLILYYILFQTGMYVLSLVLLFPPPHFILDEIYFVLANALKEDGTRLWCYECNGLDNNCTVGLLGTKKECPPSTTR